MAASIGVLMQVRPVSAATWDPALGWDFECHSNTHPSFTGLTQAQMRVELEQVNAAFEAHGYSRPQHFAYPYGDYDPTVETVVSQYRKSARMVWGEMMTYPVTNWYEMMAAQLVSTTTWSEMKGWIDTCIPQKAFLHIFTHDVSANPSEYGCTRIILMQLLDYLVQKQNAGQLTVMTMAQAYDYWSTAKAGRATVVVSFDDAYESDYTVAYPLFKARGLKGTSYIVTSCIDESDQLTWNEIAKMRTTSTTYTVHLESKQNSSPTVNVGAIFFNGTSYTLPKDVSKAAGSYQTYYLSTSGYTFDHWVTTGGVSMPNVKVNQTSVTVSGAGNLTAVYKAVPATSPASMYLVVRGSDNRIFYRVYDGSSWTGWNSLPGATSDSPSAAVCNNELHIVVRGASDGSTLWHGYIKLSDYSFSGWTLLSGWTPSAPTLTSNGTVLCLVVRGGDNRVYYRVYSFSPRGWGGWNALPSGLTSDAPAAAMLGNDLHIVVRGFSSTTTIWHIIVDPSVGVVRGWVGMDGATQSKPVLTANQTTGKLHLVVRGLDGRIYWKTYDRSTDIWGSWTVVPTGSTGDGPGATVADNKLHFVVRGSDGSTLWHRYYGFWTATYSDWTMLSGSTPSPPTLTS